MAQNFFTPASASERVPAGPVAETVALPTGGTTIRIHNAGISTAYVAFGTATPVSVSPQTGLAIAPGETEYLGAGENTLMSAVTTSQFTQLNVTAGA